MYFYASEKCSYVVKSIHTLCVIWSHFMFLLLVYHKFVEPDGHFAFELAYDVHDSFAGSS